MSFAENKIDSEINYYVVAGIVILVLLFTLANSWEPQINSQLDFFELIFVLAYAAPGIFSIIIAKRYWLSPVFGKAYLSLGVGFLCVAIGAAIFDYLQIVEKIENPYPSIAEIFFAVFYPFAIYHLWVNIRFIRGVEKPKLKKNNVMLLIIIPLTVSSIYTFSLLYVPVFTETEIQDNNGMAKLFPSIFTNIHFIEVDDVTKNEPGFYFGIFYVIATSLTFVFAIIGTQFFRGSILGAPWGMLLLGISLTTSADIAYYYTSLIEYDRSNPIIGIWVMGCMFVCYALYLHKKQI